MFKWGLHNPFGNLKYKLWPKKGLRVKLPIWFPTTKNQESPWFTSVQMTCHISLESSQWGYNFALDLTSIEGLQNKLWASKVVKVQKFQDSQLRNPKTKWHLGAGLVARHIEYYKRKGGGFPQVKVVVNLVNLCLFVVCPCTKSAPIMH